MFKDVRTAYTPIETFYSGCNFRSRLEARWAVFFNELNIPWEYEKEGFVLKRGLEESPKVLNYLPDFWLPDQDCWIEVKGAPPSDIDIKKCERLASATRTPVYLFRSIPYNDDFFAYNNGSGATKFSFFVDRIEDEAPVISVDQDYFYAWCICLSCKRLGIEFEGRSDRLSCKKCILCSYKIDRNKKLSKKDCCYGKEKCDRDYRGNLDKGRTYNDPSILNAYSKARGSRFEVKYIP